MAKMKLLTAVLLSGVVAPAYAGYTEPGPFRRTSEDSPADADTSEATGDNSEATTTTTTTEGWDAAAWRENTPDSEDLKEYYASYDTDPDTLNKAYQHLDSYLTNGTNDCIEYTKNGQCLKRREGTSTTTTKAAPAPPPPGWSGFSDKELGPKGSLIIKNSTDTDVDNAMFSSALHPLIALVGLATTIAMARE